jgi:hypothetical protein
MFCLWKGIEKNSKTIHFSAGDRLKDKRMTGIMCLNAYFPARFSCNGTHWL